MSRLLLATPYLTVQDTNGLPVAGALVSSFLSGTSTPTPLYADATTGTTLTNPAACDASGRLVAYVDRSLAYGITITDASALLIKTIDPVLYPSDVTPAVATAVPTGGVIPYTGTSAPTGFLMCDGSAVSRTTYAALFAVCGTGYGVGDNVNTFNLPGPGTAGVYFFLKSPTGTGSTLGSAFGTMDHVHSHTHVVASHTHSVPRNGWTATLHNPGDAGILLTGDSGANVYEPVGDNTSGAATPATTTGTSTTATANPSGLVFNAIIKT